MLDGLFSPAGGLDGDAQFADQGFLADVLVKLLGAQSVVEADFLFTLGLTGNNSFARHNDWLFLYSRGPHSQHLPQQRVGGF
jgi:hypothetical protein